MIISIYKFSCLLTFSPERKSCQIQLSTKFDDVSTTSHMRRTVAGENFTSARRRRAISLSMPFKVSIDLGLDSPI